MTYEEEMTKSNPIEKTAKSLQDRKRFIYGTFVDGILAGVVILQPGSFEKTKHKADLLAMYVSSDFRCLGAGSKLLSTVMKKARDLNIEQLQLTVVSTNEAVRTLYERAGFQVYGTEKEVLKVNDEYVDEVNMVLFLK